MLRCHSRVAMSREEARCSSARHQIKRFFVGDANRPRQRFVPVDKLRSYLTRPRVTWLLECRCRTCTNDHAPFRRARTEFIGSIVGPENDSNTPLDPGKTALALFALLIFIEHPLLIIGFVMRRCSDHALERTPTLFSIEHLQREYCQEYASRVGDEQFKEFATDFAEYLPKFAIPRMDSGVYSVYGPDTILPFLNEQKIGVRGPDGVVQQEGAYGKVYSFEIYEEYRQFPVGNGSCKTRTRHGAMLNQRSMRMNIRGSHGRSLTVPASWHFILRTRILSKQRPFKMRTLSK